jgi:hypothetical protein
VKVNVKDELEKLGKEKAKNLDLAQEGHAVELEEVMRKRREEEEEEEEERMREGQRQMMIGEMKRRRRMNLAQFHHPRQPTEKQANK